MQLVWMRQVGLRQVETRQAGTRRVRIRLVGMGQVWMSRFAVRPGAMQVVAGGRRSGVRAGGAGRLKSRWKPAGATGRAGSTRATAS